MLVEHLALSRLVGALTSWPGRRVIIAINAAVVLAAPFTLINPERIYNELLTPSLVALRLSQLIVLAVYPGTPPGSTTARARLGADGSRRVRRRWPVGDHQAVRSLIMNKENQMIRRHTVLADQDTSYPDSFPRRIARLLMRGPAGLASPVARWAVTLLAVAGAALLVWSGEIHLQLWFDGYRDISVIGPLFVIQGIGCIVLALVLAVFRRLALLAAGAVLLAGTAAGLLLSVGVGLFGYHESLAVPYAGTSLVVEFAGAAVLAAAAVIVLAAPLAMRRT